MTASVFNKLLYRLHEGDMSALRPIYEEYYRKLEVAAVAILRDTKDGQDAASEAIMRVIKYAQTHDGFSVERPGGFMYTIVKNVAFDMIDKNKRTVGLEEADGVAAAVVDDEQRYERAEITKAILSLLPPRREVAIMFFLYDCKISTISEELQMPPGTVKWHISAIKKYIKERLS